MAVCTFFFRPIDNSATFHGWGQGRQGDFGVAREIGGIKTIANVFYGRTFAGTPLHGVLTPVNDVHNYSHSPFEMRKPAD